MTTTLKIVKTADLNDRDFIVRMLHKSCYLLTNILFYFTNVFNIRL